MNLEKKFYNFLCLDMSEVKYRMTHENSDPHKFQRIHLNWATNNHLNLAHAYLDFAVSFYTSSKSWRGYIFTAVCLCVCVCLSVCLALL